MSMKGICAGVLHVFGPFCLGRQTQCKAQKWSWPTADYLLSVRGMLEQSHISDYVKCFRAFCRSVLFYVFFSHMPNLVVDTRSRPARKRNILRNLRQVLFDRKSKLMIGRLSSCRLVFILFFFSTENIWHWFYIRFSMPPRHLRLFRILLLIDVSRRAKIADLTTYTTTSAKISVVHMQLFFHTLLYLALLKSTAYTTHTVLSFVIV